ncbi:uncharacterized protein ASCRUDRAFT_120643 [Ascoidea rubescens DSM 1968]|uniref:MPN domain-containing protein n=1 Tax=Ascoidea rubescens DSM 1968 TaxID=1344418 RepID=A0A1D2V9R7_9ASCO|nr:hypothetical protein ASCRUDRAFT_120643 [Ascoidea rubescens DSM 1968]ODV58406.1 hypothetical protein ASCRUDRAFT_120643 [Ascoidea rubescens DSM 1968]
MKSDILHLVKPSSLASTALSPLTVNVVIQPTALFSIFEASLRIQEGNSRVIGTLLGSRSDDNSNIDIRDAYIVQHNEQGDNVTVNEYNHKTFLNIYKKTSPKIMIVGWFSTISSLDIYSSLINNFYLDGNYSIPIVHLTLDSIDPSSNLPSVPKFDTYISTMVGKSAVNDQNSTVFVPIPHTLNYSSQEKNLLSWVSKAKDQSNSSVLLPSGQSTELINLSNDLKDVDDLIDKVSNYVSQVVNGEIEGDDEVGKYLLSNIPASPNNLGISKIEHLFNSHIQDTLMLEYLASSIKTQIELSAKLTTVV